MTSYVRNYSIEGDMEDADENVDKQTQASQEQAYIHSIVRDKITDFFSTKKFIRKDQKNLKPPIKNIFQTLNSFFADKSWYLGGDISDDILFIKRNFHLINNTTIDEAIEIAYDAIGKAEYLAITQIAEEVEIDLCLKIMRECEEKRIPQHHFPGVFLLYLMLCEGVELE